MDPIFLLYAAFAILIALTFHEFSHAFIADSLGDPTAKGLGRVTLNPIAHLDPLGTIMIVLTLLSGFGLGWGKPVPVNPYRLRPSPTVGMALVAAAGPASNILLATVFAWLTQQDLPSDLRAFAHLAAIINVFLAAFNLIPIPPLDGFRVLLGVLPTRVAYSIAPFEQYGPVALLFLVFFGRGLIGSIVGAIASPVRQVLGV